MVGSGVAGVLLRRRTPRALPLGAVVILIVLTATVLGPPRPAAGATATFTVTTTVDQPDGLLGDGVCRTAAGACSLRSAVQEGSMRAAETVIEVPAGTYSLTGQNPDGTHVLRISSNVTVHGAGPGSTVVRGVTGWSVFEFVHVGSLVSSTVSGLTITGGVAAYGAGVNVNRGVVLSLADVVISGNTATSYGGGIFVWGEPGLINSVTLTRVSVSGNAAVYAGGIVNMYPSSMSLIDSEVSNNLATGLYAGGIRNHGDMTLVDSVIRGNRAGVQSSSGGPGGGGVYTGDTPHPATERSTFTMTGGSIFGNQLPIGLPSSGGGLLNGASSTVTLDGVAVASNSAFTGGGLLNEQGTMVVRRSTVATNLAYYGAGIYNDDFVPTDAFAPRLLVDRSAIIGNQAIDTNCPTQLTGGQLCGAGGGIFNENGAVDVVNSTVAENFAASYGAGVYTMRIGSGTVAQAVLQLINATVASNGGLGLGPGVLNNGGTFRARNSAVAGNVRWTTPDDCYLSPDSVNVSLGNNVSQVNNCGFTQPSDRIAAPLLSPLAAHGGSTLTMLPRPGSPLIDRGDNGTCAGSPVGGVDQRDHPRPVGSVCDIGATEGIDAAAPVLPAGLTPWTRARPEANRMP